MLQVLWKRLQQVVRRRVDPLDRPDSHSNVPDAPQFTLAIHLCSPEIAKLNHWGPARHANEQRVLQGGWQVASSSPSQASALSGASYRRPRSTNSTKQLHSHRLEHSRQGRQLPTSGLMSRFMTPTRWQ